MAADIPSPFCDVCQKQFSGWKPFEEHNNSPVHKKAVEKLLQINSLSESLMRNPSPSVDEVKVNLDEFMITEDKNLYFCKLCQVPCSGKIPALNHCLGKHHRKQKERHKFSMATAGQVLTGSSVKLGDSGSLGIVDANTDSSTVPISSSGMLNSTTTSEASSDFSVFQTNSLTGHFFCTVCNLSVSGIIPAEQHLKGKAHIKKAKRKNAYNRLLNEIPGNSSDLVSQFSCLDVSDSVCEGGKISGEENLNNEKVSKLQENLPSFSQNKLHDSVSVKHNDQTSATSIDGGTEFKGQVDEDDFEMDKVTGHRRCKVCDVTLTGEEPMRQHLAGKTHQKKKKAAGIGQWMDQGSNSWAPLVSNDFSLLRQMPQEIKGIDKETPVDVEESQNHSKLKAATEPPEKPETSLAGPQGSPYFVQQDAMKADGVVPHHTKSHLAGPQGSPYLVQQPAMKADGVVPHHTKSHLGGPQGSPYLVQQPAMKADGVVPHHTKSHLAGPQGSPYLVQQPAMTADGVVPHHTKSHLAGPQGSPYLVQQPAMKADGVVPHHTKTQVTKDVLAKENLKLAKQLSSPAPHGAGMVSPYDHKGVRSNPPLSDFLQHQNNAGMRPDMGHFWSLEASSTGFHSTISPRINSDTTKVNTTNTMDPIGTLPHTAKSGGEGVTPEQQVKEPLEKYFSIEADGKLLCKVCAISVSGSEPARQHLQGKSHIKKQRAYDFSKNHMAPYISSTAAPQGYEDHHGKFHHIPPGFPAPTAPQSSQQSMTSSSPGQQQVHPYHGGGMDPRHQGNRYHSEQHHPQFGQQGNVMRAPHPEQYNMKPFSVGQFITSQSQGLPYSSKSPPPSHQNEAPVPGYQGPVPQSLDHLDNYSFSSSSSHHSSGQFSGQYSDDKPHSLRGVSLAENLH